MNMDVYMFFTRCHVLYITGVRRAIYERLFKEHGDDWWQNGVERSLAEGQVDDLRRHVERDPSRGRHLLLDTPHFIRIIGRNSNLFSDAFRDTVRISEELRRLTTIRNDWAHIDNISLARARRSTEQMRRILTALRCDEALEIEKMSHEMAENFSSVEEENPMDEFDHPDRGLDVQEAPAPTSDLWRLLQSYLVLEKTVQMPEEEADGYVEVSLTVHNTAPHGADWPEVYFDSVYVEAAGRYRVDLGTLRPGETKREVMRFRLKQLIGIEFELFGAVDASRLFQIRRTTSLPEDVVGPLRQQFVDQLESIGIKQFVTETLEIIEPIGPDIPLADLRAIRESLKSRFDRIAEKVRALSALSRDFHLNREHSLGVRINELIQALREFGSKFNELDMAIGNTDLDSIAAAVHDLKQIQLAVLRVEDALVEIVGAL